MPVSTQNRLGKYVPAIPEPFHGLRKHCECGAKFWSMDAYRGHYALVHILHLEDAKYLSALSVQKGQQ